MKKNIIRRQSADKTREKIIKVSRKLFATFGFSGTTTMAIAKAAKVNEALIFHHFGSKLKLWKMVKASIVNGLNFKLINQEPSSLNLF